MTHLHSKRVISRTLQYFGVAILVVITLFPFYWVIRTSLTPHEAMYTEATRMIPTNPTVSNYLRVLGFVDQATAIKLGGSGQKVNFLLNMKNSFIVAIGITLFQIMFSAMAAYAFARLKFPFRDKIFGVYLATMMIPGIVMTIPNFIMVKNMGLLNTFPGIMAPALLMTPFSVFFLRQFFLGINPELEEAAMIDGAGQYLTFARIILPLSQTALVTLAVSTFISTWNDYMWPLIVGKQESMRTLTVALGIFRSQVPQGQPDWGGLMAGTVLAMIPALVIFSVFGKKIVNSIGFSGFR
jgi:multiple sugar transport system permease protein